MVWHTKRTLEHKDCVDVSRASQYLSEANAQRELFRVTQHYNSQQGNSNQ